ncbi:hypothetical protein [Veronia nyctiphanis]|nr:hypothetical protein [Veronia nyctiphanis]
MKSSAFLLGCLFAAPVLVTPAQAKTSMDSILESQDVPALQSSGISPQRH